METVEKSLYRWATQEGQWLYIRMTYFRSCLEDNVCKASFAVSHAKCHNKEGKCWIGKRKDRVLWNQYVGMDMEILTMLSDYSTIYGFEIARAIRS